MRSRRDYRERDLAVRELAERWQRLSGADACEALGWEKRDAEVVIMRGLRDGWLVRVRHGVYRPAGVL